MTTFHHQVSLQTLPLLEDNKSNSVLSRNINVSPIGLCTASSTNSDSDLLEDLWHTKSLNQTQRFESPQVMQPSNVWNSTVGSPSYASNMYERSYPDFAVNAINRTPRDQSMDYVKFLLPNNLLENGLPALTEENLYSISAGANFDSNRHSSLFSEPSSDDLFNFEQQQQQQQQQQHQQQQQQQQQQQPQQQSHQSHKSHLAVHPHPYPHTLAHQHSNGHSQSYKTNNTLNKTVNVNTQLYKTELCASYIKTGICPYGNKCQFAHGECELKSVERSPKWRSKPCANWSKFGSCRYGNRCCFKHGE